MKKSLTIMLAGMLALGLFSGCKEQTPKVAEKEHPVMEKAPAKEKMGTVTETMNAAGYTYVQVDTGEEKFWAAAPEFQVKVGDPVVVPEGLAMPNYHSKALDRDFDVVYFVNSVLVGGAQQAMGSAMGAGGQMPEGHPPIDVTSLPTGPEFDFSAIQKAADGNTVEEIFAKKDELAGKKTQVRGIVVKFRANILGKNWIHLQDGTGSEGTNDLTLNTDAMVKIGDTILASGVVALDKDFGHKYPVLIEDATVIVE